MIFSYSITTHTLKERTAKLKFTQNASTIVACTVHCVYRTVTANAATNASAAPTTKASTARRRRTSVAT